MNWLDVAGPPGIGKSTLCDPLWGHREIEWDGRLPPREWHDFLNEITRLFYLIEPHWSYVPAVRMNNRSIRKMATVARMPPQNGRGPYIQTGLVQRGLGFGWRLNDMGEDVDEIREYFRLMPVSLGVVFLTADPLTVLKRNKKRLLNPETAHENRSYQVPLMQKPIEVAKDALRERGLVVAEIDVDEQSVEEAREALTACTRASMVDEIVLDGAVRSSPPWWQ